MATQEDTDDYKNLGLHTADYIVFAAMFLITMLIGIRYAVLGRKSKSRESYFVGDRNMHFLPVALSLLVTFESSVMILGIPAEVYYNGASVLLVFFGYLVTHMLASVVSVPLFKPLQITSVYQYLHERFNSNAIRMCAVILFLAGRLFYTGIVLYGQGIAIQAVMGLNMWISIIVMDVCAVCYTSLGGIKSVVWTDVFQSLIMFVGLIAIIIKGTIDTGGTSKVWEYARKGGRLDIINFDPDPTVRHTVWTAFLPRILASFGYLFNQSTCQRISASKSLKAARWMTLVTSALYLPIFLMVIYEGIVVFAYFSHRQIEPLKCGYITNQNQILPYAVLLIFQDIPGMAGLFIATLYSASLSTISSDLSSMSVLVMEDIFKPYLKKTSEKRATMYAKLSVIGFGAGCLVFCVLVTYAQGPLNQITASLLSAFDAPLIGMFSLACFFPSVNKRAAVVGLIFGALMSGTISIGNIFAPDVKKTIPLPLDIHNGTCETGPLTSHNATAVTIHSLMGNATSLAPYDVTTTSLPHSTHNDTTSDPSYNPFFSLSYTLFAPLGIVTTLVIAVISSFIFGRNKPGDVNPIYFLELSDSLLIFLPPPVRRWLKGIGPQYKKGWKTAGKEIGEGDTLKVSTIELQITDRPGEPNGTDSIQSSQPAA